MSTKVRVLLALVFLAGLEIMVTGCSTGLDQLDTNIAKPAKNMITDFKTQILSLNQLSSQQMEIVLNSTHKGILYNVDSYDRYVIRGVDTGVHVDVNLNGPSDADFDLYVQQCNQQHESRSYSSREEVTFTTACATDIWIFPYAYSGTGSYTFSVQGSGGASRRLPTLSVDGKTSSTRSVGQTFSLTGSGYTSNQTVTRHIVMPGGTEITPTIDADSSGDIAWTFTPDCSTPIGSYSLWVVDDVARKTSNTVTEVITTNSSCTVSPNNDYPYLSANPNSVDPWHFYFRECTSFVAWRIRSRTSATNFTNQYAGLSRWGNAFEWSNAAQTTAAQQHGVSVHSQPAVGRVAQWASRFNGAASNGHVAFVSAVYPDGSILVEEYNYTNAHGYDTRRIRPGSNRWPSIFIQF